MGQWTENEMTIFGFLGLSSYFTFENGPPFVSQSIFIYLPSICQHWNRLARTEKYAVCTLF